MKQSPKLSALDFITHGFYDAHDSYLDENPILMDQVHSADVLLIDTVPTTPPQVDAVITKTPNLNLTVKTADCAPVLLVDTQAKIIAAVHAGWKGAFQGIIESTVLKMVELGCNPVHMIAAVGPHIQKQSFEIDSAMFALFPKTETHFFTPTDSTHYLFDFDSYVIHRLHRAGITQIDTIPIDTYTSSNYNSYRREPENLARQYSSIKLKSDL